MTLPDGSKEALHSHDWRVVAAVSAEQLDKMGLVMDFCRLNDIIDNVISSFEKTRLEQLDIFSDVSSSAENVAKYVFDIVEPLLPLGVKLEYVRVTETPGCAATYAK